MRPLPTRLQTKTDGFKEICEMRHVNLDLHSFIAVMLLMIFPHLACAQDGASTADNRYAGSDACIECHEDYYASYLKNRHGYASDPRTPAARQGCESCHGPGAEHAESDGEKPIRSLKPDSAGSADEKSAVCLSCHTNGRQALWSGSEHQSRNLSCTSCHNIHKNNPDNLVRKNQWETCTQCHKSIRAQWMRQSHHPLREGKMECADCHNSHGTVADKLVDAQTINAKCFECHAQLRGPFLWEHPPVTEDCLTCHTPHGSTHSGLLKAKVPFLCQRCHANVGHPGELAARSSADANQSVYRALNNRVFYRACINCHVAIHGTNHPSGKSLVR
jgi:DmsE family decaheme c-type cytochrome